MTPKSLCYIYFFVCIAVSLTRFPDGLPAVALSAVLCVGIYSILRRLEPHRDDLVKFFLMALIVRVLASATIDLFQVANVFALDWNLYDKLGNEVAQYWVGGSDASSELQRRVFSLRGTSWGMCLFVGSIYSVAGRNLLAAQLVIATISSAAAPFAYLCTIEMFKNRRAARIAGYFVAFTPSLVLWSSLVLKDGLIVFFLVLVMYLAARLQKEFNYLHLFALLFSLIGVMALRNYIFYIVSVSVVGGFLVGQKNSIPSLVGRVTAIAIIGLSLGYIGILNNAQFELNNMTSLESIAISRRDLSQSAASGFGREYDVSTVDGTIAVLPIGLTYLILAPFPWQLTSALALAAFPETFLWWMMLIPVAIGISYSVRNRLRNCISILVFTLMLTIGYSVLQGNVGTAYRQRAQIQIFLFIFAAVGVNILLEKGEDKKLIERARQRNFAERQRGGVKE